MDGKEAKYRPLMEQIEKEKSVEKKTDYLSIMVFMLATNDLETQESKINSLNININKRFKALNNKLNKIIYVLLGLIIILAVIYPPIQKILTQLIKVVL